MIQIAQRPVTAEQKEHFEDLGYCVVDGLFSEEDILDIENFFEEYRVNGGLVYDGGLTHYEEVDYTKRQVRAMQPHRFSDRVKQWFLHPNVANALADLLGKPALGVQTMYYFKPPGAKGQGMHQDNFYLVSKPATCIAAWTAIDAADEENGCLWVVPGSHKSEILCPEKGGERWLNYGDSHITKFPRENKPIPVPVPRGSTLFFGGNLIHGSGPNRAENRWRRTFIGHYIDEASNQVAKYYHPVLDMEGKVVSDIAVFTGGGPCGDNWEGAVH